MLGHGTFSIVASDIASGQHGVAIASKLPCVGSFCPVLRPGLGAAVTQGWTNPAIPDRVFERIGAGEACESALTSVMTGEVESQLRQVAVVDVVGRVAAFTGAEVETTCGERLGSGFAVVGNMLPGFAVLDAMAEHFAGASGNLATRLLTALEAGHRRGGDARGTRSAALKVIGSEVFPLVDLRADDHHQPVEELARLLHVASGDLARFIRALPTRTNPRGRFETVRDLRPSRRRT